MKHPLEQKRTLLLVIDHLAGGGAEAFVVRLAEGFAARGHEVHIVIFADVVDFTLPDSVQLHRLTRVRLGRPVKALYYHLAARELNRCIAALKVSFDLILANLPLSHRIVMQAGLHNAHYIIHSCYYSVYVAAKSDKQQQRQMKKFRRRFHNRNLVFVSHAAKRELLEQIGVQPKQSIVIYNPIPIQEIIERSQQPISQQAPFFLHVGRYHPVKRHDRLLQLYQRSGVTDRLLLMGRGSNEQRAVIEDQISALGLSDQVVLLDFQENPYPYMRAAKALLLCSDLEGFGNVVVEALATGCSVLVMDEGSGPSEILSPPQMRQCLFAFSEQEAFANAIKYRSSQPMSVSYEAAELQRFELDRIIDDYLSL